MPRIALVVGNRRYADTEWLNNAVRDAEAMAAVLRPLRFQVHLRCDLDATGLRSATQTFIQLLETRTADVALFYYSGHGVQLHDKNYLVPSDFRFDHSDPVSQLIDLQDLIQRISSRTRVTLVFLDACRDNPFIDAISVTGVHAHDTVHPALPERTKSIAGLAELRPAGSTFIAFAAAPGHVAWEGAGPLSYFTEYLTRFIAITDLPLSNLMIRVRNGVLLATQGRQEPWDHSSLTSSFFFNPAPLILLVGNALGLIAFLFSLFPYSVALRYSDELGWVLLGASLAASTLFLFLLGLQRSYTNLRAAQQIDGSDTLASGQKIAKDIIRKGGLGGFFGAAIGAPVITFKYIAIIEPFDEVIESFRFINVGQIAVEIAFACLAISLLLGPIVLGMSEICAPSRAVQFSGRWFNLRRIAGAIVGGLITGSIIGPAVGMYFGPTDRPSVSPVDLLPGALLGTAALVFSIVNYSLERLSFSGMIKSGAYAMGATVFAMAITLGLLWMVFPDLAFRIEMYMVMGEFIVGGLCYGLLIGAVLGLAIGVTLALSGRDTLGRVV